MSGRHLAGSVTARRAGRVGPPRCLASCPAGRARMRAARGGRPRVDVVPGGGAARHVACLPAAPARLVGGAGSLGRPPLPRPAWRRWTQAVRGCRPRDGVLPHGAAALGVVPDPGRPSRREGPPGGSGRLAGRGCRQAWQRGGRPGLMVCPWRVVTRPFGMSGDARRRRHAATLLPGPGRRPPLGSEGVEREVWSAMAGRLLSPRDAALSAGLPLSGPSGVPAPPLAGQLPERQAAICRQVGAVCFRDQAALWCAWLERLRGPGSGGREMPEGACLWASGC